VPERFGSQTRGARFWKTKGRSLLTSAQATRDRASKLRREALAWIVSEDRSNVFAFENICEALGIDAGWLRAKVLTREPLR